MTYDLVILGVIYGTQLLCVAFLYSNEIHMNKRIMVSKKKNSLWNYISLTTGLQQHLNIIKLPSPRHYLRDWDHCRATAYTGKFYMTFSDISLS